MRIKKNINLGIISRYNNKFSKLTLQVLYCYKCCIVDIKENYKFGLEVKGLNINL